MGSINQRLTICFNQSSKGAWDLDKYLFIALGAIPGAFCRYWTAAWAARWGGDFPYGTLVINLTGSFVLGLFLTLHLDRGWFPPQARLAVAVGWCASFTTYSTFSWETFRLIQVGDWKLAGLNISATLLGCLVATGIGAALGKAL
jgi:CrcB protein